MCYLYVLYTHIKIIYLSYTLIEPDASKLPTLTRGYSYKTHAKPPFWYHSVRVTHNWKAGGSCSPSKLR